MAPSRKKLAAEDNDIVVGGAISGSSNGDASRSALS
jgi:hypothetical protein